MAATNSRRLVDMADREFALDFDVRLGHPLLDEVLTDGANDLNGPEVSASASKEGGGIIGQPVGAGTPKWSAPNRRER